MALSPMKQAFIDRFKTIMNYAYYDHSYGESHYLNIYKKDPAHYNKQPTEYQDEMLREWMRVEPWVLREYVLDQKKLGETFCLYTNQIDLQSRVRNDTSQEFPGTHIVFPEPRYVFALANDKKGKHVLHIRFWADGILVGDIYQRRKRFMDYIYVPCDFISADSYLEIEIFPEYYFTETVTFTSAEDRRDITLPAPDDGQVIFPTSRDLFASYYMYYEGTGQMFLNHFNRSTLHIAEKYDNGKMYDVETTDPSKPVEFTRISKFQVHPDATALEMIGTPVDITIMKIPHFSAYRCTHDGYAYIELADNDELDWNFDLNYLRIFVNGRLLPRTHYTFEDQFDRPRLFFYDKFEKGQMIYIDITPYQYKLIYFSPQPIYGEPAIIDLKNVIDKPFDPRYFDVYMNGKRLSLNNIFALTPWQIALVNLTSYYNLEIYERERDYEWYGLDYTQHLYPYTTEDLFAEAFMRSEDKSKLITDIINKLKDNRLTVNPNENRETPYEHDMDKFEASIQMLLFYYNELIPNGYAYGYELQYNLEHIKKAYRKIYEIYGRHPEDYAWDIASKERKQHYPVAYELDADILVEGADSPEERENAIYVIGYLDEVPDEQLHWDEVDDYNVLMTSQNSSIDPTVRTVRGLNDTYGDLAFENVSDVLPPGTLDTQGIVQLSANLSEDAQLAVTPSVISNVNASVMHVDGNEMIGGVKSFTSSEINIGDANIKYGQDTLTIS